MMSTCATQHQQSSRINQQPGNQQDDQQHGEDSQQKLEQLLKNQPAAIQLFTLQQELHGRKPDSTVAESTEDVNQNRQQHQRSPRQKKCRVQKKLR